MSVANVKRALESGRSHKRATEREKDSKFEAAQAMKKARR